MTCLLTSLMIHVTTFNTMQKGEVFISSATYGDVTILERKRGN